MSRNDEIIYLVSSGHSFRAVAKQLGLTIGAVAGVCRRAGVKGAGKKVFCAEALAQHRLWRAQWYSRPKYYQRPVE